MNDGGPRFTDSAGTPWQGRRLESTGFEADDGSAPAQLSGALRAFRRGELGEAEVVATLREVRLLVPLVALRATSAVSTDGPTAGSGSELSIVTVAGPDGRDVLPVFSSVAAMSDWNPGARPVPADARRVALAAADEGTDLVVLDPTCETEFVLRRPALWAIAQSLPWVPSYLDPEVAAEFDGSVELERVVRAVVVGSGDPGARLTGPELAVTLQLDGGLDAAGLDALLARLRETWSRNTIIAARVDSLAVRVEAFVSS